MNEEIQNAINLAVWYIEQGEAELALSVLMPFYSEGETRKADAADPQNVLIHRSNGGKI